MILHARGKTAVAMLAQLKGAHGFAVPLGLVVGASEPGTKLDFVADQASLVGRPDAIAVRRPRVG